MSLCDSYFSGGVPEAGVKMRANMISACGPLRRMVPIPPTPGGVAIATIVSWYIGAGSTELEHHEVLVNIVVAYLESPRLSAVGLEANRTVGPDGRFVAGGYAQVDLVEVRDLAAPANCFLHECAAHAFPPGLRRDINPPDHAFMNALYPIVAPETREAHQPPVVERSQQEIVSRQRARPHSLGYFLKWPGDALLIT